MNERAIEIARESLEIIRMTLDTAKYEDEKAYESAVSAYWKLRNFITLAEKDMNNK